MNYFFEISLKCERELRSLTPAPAFSENLKVKKSPKKRMVFCTWFARFRAPPTPTGRQKSSRMTQKKNSLSKNRAIDPRVDGWQQRFFFMAKFRHFSTKKLGNFCFTSVNLD
jgi:hypothetical protein